MNRRILFAAAPALAAGSAWAFRLETTPTDVQEEIAAACGRRSFHDELRREVDRLLPPETRSKMAADAVDELGRAATCPFCGCGVLPGKADHGESPRR